MPNSETKNFSQNVSSSYHLEDKNKNVPKLRFKEYHDEWVEKRIEQVLKIKHGKDQKAIENNDGIYPILATSGEIGRSNTFLWDKPCVLIGRKGTINKPQYMDTPFWAVDTLFYSDVFQNNNAKYLYYLFNTINWKKYDESTGVPSLSAKTIERIKIKISNNLREQEKIASFLTLIDKKIEKQKELVKLLKKYKRGLFKSIFDTISDCKAVLLENIANLVKGTQLSKIDMIVDGKYYVLNGGTTPSGKTNSYNTIANTISISEGGNSCGYVNYNIEPFWSGGHCYTLQNINSTMNKRFLYHYLKFKENNIMMLRIGSGLPNIQKSSLLKFQIIVPELKIQNKYSKLFDNIENYEKIQIELLDKISYLKKALLQQMFI